MKRENINEEINKTLASLDGMDRAEASPFLYTRVKARLSRKQEKTFWLMSFLLKPTVALAILFITAMLNVYALSNFSFVKQRPNADAAVESFAKEYGIAGYSAFDKSN